MLTRTISLARLTVGLSVLLAGLQAGPVSAARTPKEIDADLQQVEPDIKKWGPIDTVMDPKFRQGLHDQLLPALQKKIDLLNELLKAQPSAKANIEYQLNVDMALAAVLGDDASSKAMETAAAGADSQGAETAKMGLAMRDWWLDQSEAHQQTVLDSLIAMAKAKPSDDTLARALITLADNRAASTELADKARSAVEAMKCPFAIRYRAIPNRIGRPLIISGTSVDGKSISSLALKGKVVMVDFWATWCPPCREELPHVIDIYKKYHDQGFEIIGISNDIDRKELRQFLKDNADMKWPQLFGPSSTPSHWNTLSVKFGVNSIPTVYLIDRAGILRTMNGRMHLDDDTIPQLLAEKAPTAAKSGS